MKWLNHLSRMTAAAAFAAAIAVAQVGTAQQAATAPAGTTQQAADAQQAGNAQQAANAQQSGDAQQAASQQGDAAQSGQNEQQASEQQTQAQRQLEIIQLKHRDPQHLTQLMGLWDQVAMPGYTGRGRVAVQRPNMQQQPNERLAIAMDNEKKMMFVRGTAEQIEKIKALVTAVDVDDDALKPQDFANHRLIPVSSNNSSQIQSTLTQLDLAGQLVQVGNTTFIAYKVDDENDKNGERRKQAEEVINKLTGQQQAEGQQAEGQQAEGQQAEGQQAEGQQAEGQQAEGQQAEGQQAEGQQAEGQQAEGQPAAGEAAGGA